MVQTRQTKITDGFDLPVEFRERVRGGPAEPPVRVGADEPRAAAAEGGAPSGRWRPEALPQPCAPAGETSANDAWAAEPAPHQVHTGPGIKEGFFSNLLKLLITG